jgi:signal transduction histidine kinase
MLASVILHELRTPLTPVLMWTDGIAQEPTIPEDLRDGLQMVARSVELETSLIDDLLDLTRITRGELRLHLQKSRPASAPA